MPNKPKNDHGGCEDRSCGCKEGNVFLAETQELEGDAKYIQAQELFCNQACSKCGSFLAVCRLGKTQEGVYLLLECLNEDCDYVSSRELI